MRVLHVQVKREGKWYIAQGLEETGVITQGRTLDEIVANLREVMELMFGVRRVQIEIILPAEKGGIQQPAKVTARVRSVASPPAPAEGVQRLQ